MEIQIPNSYNWFVKLKLIKFIPWHFEEILKLNSIGNESFRIENNSNREVLTFGRRQDMDTFAGFEIINHCCPIKKEAKLMASKIIVI